MKLTVLERLNLLHALPSKSDVLTLRIMKPLKEELSFTEEEHKVLNFIQDKEGLRFNNNAVPEKDVQIGEKATDVIVDVLKKLHEAGAVHETFLSLYDKFNITF